MTITEHDGHRETAAGHCRCERRLQGLLSHVITAAVASRVTSRKVLTMARCAGPTASVRSHGAVVVHCAT